MSSPPLASSTRSRLLLSASSLRVSLLSQLEHFQRQLTERDAELHRTKQELREKQRQIDELESTIQHLIDRDSSSRSISSSIFPCPDCTVREVYYQQQSQQIIDKLVEFAQLNRQMEGLIHELGENETAAYSTARDSIVPSTPSIPSASSAVPSTPILTPTSKRIHISTPTSSRLPSTPSSSHSYRLESSLRSAECSSLLRENERLRRHLQSKEEEIFSLKQRLRSNSLSSIESGELIKQLREALDQSTRAAKRREAEINEEKALTLTELQKMVVMLTEQLAEAKGQKRDDQQRYKTVNAPDEGISSFSPSVTNDYG